MSTTNNTTLYVVFPYYEWLEFKKTGYIPNDTFYPEITRKWVCDQVHERIKNKEKYAQQKETITDPMYCYVTKPNPRHTYPRKHVVCKIRVPDVNDIVYFDDMMYIRVLNSITGYGKYYYCAYSEQEFDAKEHASKEECFESCKRMFEVEYTPERKISWVGPVVLRAFIPALTRDMIRKVWVYSGNGKKK